MKKKTFDWKRLLIIGAIPTALGAIILSARVITTYADLPKEVKETKEDVIDLKQYVAEQQKANEINARANELVQKQLEEKKEVIYSPDGKWFWDDEAGEWKPVKKGK